MKTIKCLAVAICPFFFALAGCYLPRPILQASYVDTGSQMVWPATGRPFQINWQNNPGPCASSDSLKSNGKSDVVCHAVIPGSYRYYVGKPSSPGLRVTQPPPVFILMHVGTCNQCSILYNRKDWPQIPTGGTSPPTGNVTISCPSSGVTTADQPTGPAGLTVNSTVWFDFDGSYIDGVTPMTLRFAADECSNGPSGKDFVITGNSGYCVVNKSPTVSYSATANQCSQSQLTLSVNP